MPGRNANAYSDRHAFTYRNSDSDGNSYSDRYGYDHTTAIGYANSYCYRNGNIHAEANADAKAAANPVPASDAVSAWARRLKELQSKRELARPCPDRYAKRCGRGNSRVLALWWIDFFQGDGNRVAGGASYRQQAAIAFANTLRTTRSICAFGKPK